MGCDGDRVCGGKQRARFAVKARPNGARSFGARGLRGACRWMPADTMQRIWPGPGPHRVVRHCRGAAGGSYD